MTLDSSNMFIRNCNPQEIDPNYWHVFVHEYWHYLQNISTLSGFKSFAFTQHLLVPFSQTLLKNANGISDGSCVLDATEQMNIKTLLNLQTSLEGDCAPSLDLRNDWEVDFRVTGINQADSPLLLYGKPIPNPTLTLELECIWPDGRTSCNRMQLGTWAIKESVAYLVTQQAMKEIETIPNRQKVPVFPYRVLEKTLQYIFDFPVDQFIVAAIGTLSLLSTHPGSDMLQIADAFRSEMQIKATSDEALRKVIETHKQSIEPLISGILSSDLPDLTQMQKGRGLMEGALAYIETVINRAFRERLRDPLFDLSSMYPRMNTNSLLSLQRRYPPCNVLQERFAQPGIYPQDILYSFDSAGKDDSGNSPSSYIRSLHAQQDYLLAHLRTDGSLQPSEQCKSHCCPYFMCCNLQLRKNEPEICMESPWLSYNTEDSFSCWYASGVAATLGNVRIGSNKVR